MKKRLVISAVTVLLCFAADGVDLEIAGDGHPTAAAYRVAARYVAQETQKLALRSVAIADTSGR